MIAYIQSISTQFGVLLTELTTLVTYIDSYPVLYCVGLLSIIIEVVVILDRLSRVN